MKTNKMHAAGYNESVDLINQLASCRQAKKLSQAWVAKKMDTTASAIARLEAGGGKKHHSPTMRTIYRYAEALGLVIIFKIREEAKDE